MEWNHFGLILEWNQLESGRPGLSPVDSSQLGNWNGMDSVWFLGRAAPCLGP